MAVDLLNLEPQKISKNLRGKFSLIYGEAGVGKTTLASKFEKVLIASFEMGSNGLNNVYVYPVRTWKTWKDMVKQLTKSAELKDKYYSIAIDTVDEAWTLCTKWVCSQHGVTNLGDVPYGVLYDEAKKEFASTFRELGYEGYGLIFISHSTEKPLKGDKNKDATRIEPALQPRPFDVINKMVDIIAYIREINVGTEDEPKRVRYMFMRDEVGDRFLAKSRYRYIQPKVELDYNKFVNAIYDAIDKEIQESGGEATNDVNPYTQRDFDELMLSAKQLWNMAKEQGKTSVIQQILEKTFGKPTKFSEIESSQIDELNTIIEESCDALGINISVL